LKYVNGVEQE